MYHPTKNEVNRIDSLGGVRIHTHTDTHTQRSYGLYSIDDDINNKKVTRHYKYITIKQNL